MLNTERLCLGCMNDNGGENVCTICGYDSREQNPQGFLPVKYWIRQRYLVGRATDNNGEGVTYIGWDNKEDTVVNIREYFPKGAAERNADNTVKIVKGNEFTFNEGIMNFLELNRKLQKLSNLPALSPVTEVFEENGTAYSITKSVQGITLREFLVRNGGNLKWEQARPLFLPLITTVASLHEAGIIHRGISPETILVGRDGKLRLSGICIRPVRMANSNMAIQLFPGYSAVEQCGMDIESRDGKYTDVYGMAATLFRVLLGKAPTDVKERISGDNMQIPARFAETIPPYVLTALANGLQIMPQDRVQDMDSFRIALTPVGGNTTTTFKSAPATVASTARRPEAEKAPESKGSGKKYAVISAVITAAVFIALALTVYFVFLSGNDGGGGTTSDNSSSAPSISIPTNSENIIIPPDSTDKLYQVPNIVGKKYADVIENTDYNTWLAFEIVEKRYSDKYDRGFIIEQKQTSDQTVKKGSTIQIVVSLGPAKVKVPDVTGKTPNEAIFELMKKGFAFDNIKSVDGYSGDVAPGVIIRTEPAAGTAVDNDTRIVLYINSQSGGESDSQTAATSSATSSN